MAIEPTLSQALSQVFGANFSSGGTTPPKNGGGSTASGKAAAVYLKQAATDWQTAETDLKNGDLGGYQSEVNAMEQQIQLAQSALTKK